MYQNPALLVNTDKYLFLPEDFIDRLHKLVFSTIFNLFYDGAEKINITEINEYLKKYPELYHFFNEQKGNDFILSASEIAELDNFDYYYQRTKKLSLLRTIKESGFSIEHWYPEGIVDIGERQQLEQKLEKSTIQDIVHSFQNKLFEIESTFINKKNFKFGSAAEGIRELVAELKETPEIGMPLQGKLFTTITRGARKAKVFCMSGATGTGKTRLALGNACKLAYPFYWDKIKEQWVNKGCNQKVIFITTELEFDENQTIILANLAGINEEKILNGSYNKAEEKRLQEAIHIMEYYKDNLNLYHMPDPTIEQMNNNIKRLVISKKIDAVFFDYVHTSPQLLAEFSGMSIREDVVLMLMTTALKNLANELDIFIWTGTQLNKAGTDADFSDEGSLRGSRAIGDKLDMGCVIRMVNEEKLKTIKDIIQQTGMKPNMYIDIYKNRRSKYKRVRLWVDVDLGTARISDLFLTDEFGNQLALDLLYAIDETALCDIKNIFDKGQEQLENKPVKQITL